MFGLLYGLWKQLSSKPCYYVLIAGLDGAGKTVSVLAACTFFPSLPQTFLEKAKGQYMKQKALEANQIQPTVGLNSTRLAVLCALTSLQLACMIIRRLC